MNKILSLVLAAPLVATGCSGKNAKSCTTTNGTITCPDGTSASIGATGTAGKNGTSTLVNVVAEPAGANCADGGEAIETGVDTNGNGKLDPSEVTSTSYVCASATAAGSDTIQGDVQIVNSLQLASLAGVKTITGSLSINAPLGLAAISLPTLTHVASFSLEDDNGTLTSLSLPALATVDTSFEIDGGVKTDGTVALTTLDLSALTSAQNLYLYRVGAPTIAPKLASLTGDFTLNGYDNVSDTILDLAVTTLPPAAAFATLTGSVDIEGTTALTDLSPLAGLKTVNGFTFVQNSTTTTTTAATQLLLPTFDTQGSFQVDSTGITTLSAPALTAPYSIEIDFDGALTSVSFTGLTSVTEGFNMSGLSQLGPTLALDALVSVGPNSGFGLQDMPLLTSLSLPSFQSANTVSIYNTGLTTLSLDAVTFLQDIDLENNAALDSISAAQLTSLYEMHLVTNVLGAQGFTMETAFPLLTQLSLFTATGNTGLSDCDATTFAQNLHATSVDVENNAPGSECP